jgi:hypothetical protein
MFWIYSGSVLCKNGQLDFQNFLQISFAMGFEKRPQQRKQRQFDKHKEINCVIQCKWSTLRHTVCQSIQLLEICQRKAFRMN